MSTVAPAFVDSEAGSPDALNTALFSAFITAYKTELGTTPSYPAVHKLIQASDAIRCCSLG